jgi:rubredoxin
VANIALLTVYFPFAQTIEKPYRFHRKMALKMIQPLSPSILQSMPHIRIFASGGMISPGDLLSLTNIAREIGSRSIGLGSRQELYLGADDSQLEGVIGRLEKANLRYDTGQQHYQNIVTSFTALDICSSTPWLLTDSYLEVLDKFDYQPRLKVNITDPLQGLVPHFTGELNFVASSYPRHWHLYLQLPRFAKTGTAPRQIWPGLVDSDDVAALAKLIEDVYWGDYPSSITELHDQVNARFKGRFRQPTQELAIPAQPFPVYEGWHRAGNRCWLGIYRRSHSFPISFLEAFSEQSMANKIGKIGLTPWKSLLVKGIREESQLGWEKMLGKFTLLTQHSSLELNWQLPDLDPTAIRLRDSLVRELDEKEMRTSGLSFAIRTSPMTACTSVLIEPEPHPTGAEETFQILHTPDFSTGHLHWEAFAQGVKRDELVDTLAYVCQAYYAQMGETAAGVSEEEAIPAPAHPVHQCPNCLTVYNSIYGEPSQNIVAGTFFDDLPEDYACSLCDTPKWAFVFIEDEKQLYNASASFE